MTRFAATTTSQAVVAATRADIWAVLTDPVVLPKLTPLLKRIQTDGDLWRWHLAGLSVLGIGISPVFTERMTFTDAKRIEYTHAPPAGTSERTGAEGWYELTDVDGGTRLEISLTLHVDLPLSGLARPAVRAIMEQTMQQMGDRFSANLLRHLGVDGAMSDPIDEWVLAQRRVIELVEGLSPEQAQIRVPACPDWTVRDLFSHMVGLGSDVVAGDEPDDHNAEWTARQIAQRRDHDLAALVTEWEKTAGPLKEWMHAHGPRPLGDVIIHEQDLRGAVGVPGGQHSAGVALIRDRFAERVAAALGPDASLALVGGTWSFGEPDTAAVVVRASDFDLARALVTRRSAAQLRAWTVRGDVEPYLAAFALLGPLPAADLTE